MILALTARIFQINMDRASLILAGTTPGAHVLVHYSSTCPQHNLFPSGPCIPPSWTSPCASLSASCDALKAFQT